MERALGIDTSRWSGKMDFAKAVLNGASFVYCKTSQWFVDPMFKEHWAGAKASGILRGGYHYLDWGKNEIDQAKLFVDLLIYDPGELPPMLDLEANPAPFGLNASVVSGKVWNFLTYVEKALKRTPILYTGYYYWNSYGSNNVGWTHFPFWLAWYAPEWYIRLRTGGTGAPKPWTNWTFWQNSGNGNGPAFGSQGLSMDTDFFNGTIDDLKKFAVGTPAPVPTPNGTPYIVNPHAVNVRKGPGTSYAVLRWAAQGQILYVVGNLTNGYVQLVDGTWVYLSYLSKV